MLATQLPGSVIYARLFLALLVILGGVRAVGVSSFLGSSRLTQEPFSFAGMTLVGVGVLLIVAGLMLAAGLLTRVAAFVPLVISVTLIVYNWPDVGGVFTAAALDSTILAFGAAGIAVLLIFRGAGKWSVDAMIADAARE